MSYSVALKQIASLLNKVIDVHPLSRSQAGGLRNRKQAYYDVLSISEAPNTTTSRLHQKMKASQKSAFRTFILPADKLRRWDLWISRPSSITASCSNKLFPHRSAIKNELDLHFEVARNFDHGGWVQLIRCQDELVYKWLGGQKVRGHGYFFRGNLFPGICCP